MNVIIYPHGGRPGVGLRPRREAQRPFLPQHSRHCPVLEAGSASGFMVYPPLEPHEAFHMEFLGDGRYQFEFFLQGPRKWEPLFSVVLTLPLSGVGMSQEEVTFKGPNPPIDRLGALRMMRAFIIPEDCGTPAGAVTLLGAHNFQTPAGWDTVYTPVLNLVERPLAPMLIIRVETDWFPQESEFRYLLQVGEGIMATHSMPLGQVLFVPREEVQLIDGTAEEIARRRAFKEEFQQRKSETKLSTRYGLQYSPHYVNESRARREAAVRTRNSELSTAQKPEEPSTGSEVE